MMDVRKRHRSHETAAAPVDLDKDRGVPRLRHVRLSAYRVIP